MLQQALTLEPGSLGLNPTPAISQLAALGSNSHRCASAFSLTF